MGARLDIIPLGVYFKDETLARPLLASSTRCGRGGVGRLRGLLVLQFVRPTDKDVRCVRMRTKLDGIRR